MKVAVHAFEGITMFHLAAPLLVFEAASAIDPDGPWRTTVWTDAGGFVRTSEGLALHDLAGPEAADDADLLVFPSWPTELPVPGLELVALVRAAHRRGARIAGLCLGAFPVAGSGLLDSRAAV